VRLSNPHIFCDAVIVAIPTIRRARVMSTKNAVEAMSCGRSIVRGNMPMAEIAIEPRARLAMPHCPGRLDGRLLPRPKANIRLSTPVKISPQLNNIVVEPSTPRTLMWFSVQLNQGELEIATNRVVRPTSWEVMPQTPAVLLSIVPLLELTPLINLPLSNEKRRLVGLILSPLGMFPGY